MKARMTLTWRITFGVDGCTIVTRTACAHQAAEKREEGYDVVAEWVALTGHTRKAMWEGACDHFRTPAHPHFGMTVN